MADCFNYVLANLACVVFLGTVLFTLDRGVDKQISSVLLARITRMLVIYFIADSIWILFQTGVWPSNKTVMYIATIIPYLCLLITSWMWLLYCEVVQGNGQILSHKKTFITILPLYIAVLLLIIGLFTDYLFDIGESGHLEYGPLYGVLLCAPFGYLLYSSIKAFRRAYTSNRYYDHGLYMAMGLFPIPPLICGVLQAIYLTVPIMCYGATAAVLFLFITSTENKISTDPLTRINNRQEMQRYLTVKMKSRPFGMELYLLILDVDHFKEINDKYGHIEGDKALVTVAEAMKHTFNSAKNRAFLSRFGGDEFIVIIEAENEQQVQEKVDELRSNIVESNEKTGAEFKLEACVGYARYDYDNPVTIPQLIERADEKLYEMKNSR